MAGGLDDGLLLLGELLLLPGHCCRSCTVGAPLSRWRSSEGAPSSGGGMEGLNRAVAGSSGVSRCWLRAAKAATASAEVKPNATMPGASKNGQNIDFSAAEPRFLGLLGRYLDSPRFVVVQSARNSTRRPRERESGLDR